MEGLLKIVYYSLSLIFILVCGLIFLSNAWSFWSTIKEESGLNGSMYSYYQLSRAQYEVYNLIVAAFSMIIAFRILFFLLKFNKQKLIKSLFQCFFFFVLLVILQIYLSSRFVGKG